MVIFWKANDGSNKLTTEIDRPSGKPLFFDGHDVANLSKPERDTAVYKYVGDWKEDEKTVVQNFDEEYRKWLSSRQH